MSYNRGNSKYTFPIDANGNVFLGAASSADGISPVVLEVNPSTHELLVTDQGVINALGNISGTTKYVTLIDDTTTANVTYIGKAVPTGSAIATSGTSWQITKIDETGSPTSIKYADGDLLFNNVWDNRATSITYA